MRNFILWAGVAAVAAASLAFFFNSVLAGKLADHLTASPVAVAPRPSPVPQEGHRMMSLAGYMDPIVERSLFDSSPTSPTPAAGEADLSASVLITAVAERPAFSTAWIVVEDAGTPGIFGIGDAIADATIVDITRRRVWVERSGGERQYLSLGGKGAALAAKPAADASDLRSAITKTGEGRYRVERDALRAALENPGKAIKGAGVVPNYKDGQSHGFRLSKAHRDSLVRDLGLKRNDVIIAIDGQPATMETALQKLGTVDTATGLTLEFERNGETIRLEYQID